MRDYEKRKRPASLDDNPDTQADLSLVQYYRKECVLDTFINVFEEKIKPTLDKVLPMAKLLQPPFPDNSDEEDVVALCRMSP